jgi:hypothetical protein
MSSIIIWKTPGLPLAWDGGDNGGDVPQKVWIRSELVCSHVANVS